jgi:hypothetical protein
MGWYSVRCVFFIPPDMYEERITAWRAASFDEAIERAELDAAEYAANAQGAYVGLAQAYYLAGPFDDGAEIFSMIRDSMLTPTDYIDKFFDTGREHQRHAPPQPPDRAPTETAAPAAPAEETDGTDGV